MLRELHQHMVSELQQSARTDTVFVVTAVIFDLVVLGINSAAAGSAAAERDGSASADLILAVFVGMSALVNGFAVAALYLGKQTRIKLMDGLLAMYRDQDVGKYYEPTLLRNYSGRYWLLTGVVLCLGLTSVAVPLIIRLA